MAWIIVILVLRNCHHMGLGFFPDSYGSAPQRRSLQFEVSLSPIWIIMPPALGQPQIGISTPQVNAAIAPIPVLQAPHRNDGLVRHSWKNIPVTRPQQRGPLINLVHGHNYPASYPLLAIPAFPGGGAFAIAAPPSLLNLASSRSSFWAALSSARLEIDTSWGGISSNHFA